MESVMLLPTEYLECPCCGDCGAFPDADGLYEDGQALLCECPGHVSADEGWADIFLDDSQDCEACKKAAGR